MSDLKLNRHGVNAKIHASILPEEKMQEIGFTDNCKEMWYFLRGIQFPKNKKYRGFEVSFSVTIPKNGSDIRIDVLDEAFCQPYDYQYMLEKNPNFEPCLIVKEQVEHWMSYLQGRGVLTGHEAGEYI